MSKALTANELRGLSREQLNATGQLESHGRLREVRKDIARVYTVLQERNLGIVDEPAIQEK